MQTRKFSNNQGFVFFRDISLLICLVHLLWQFRPNRCRSFHLLRIVSASVQSSRDSVRLATLLFFFPQLNKLDTPLINE